MKRKLIQLIEMFDEEENKKDLRVIYFFLKGFVRRKLKVKK